MPVVAAGCNKCKLLISAKGTFSAIGLTERFDDEAVSLSSLTLCALCSLHEYDPEKHFHGYFWSSIHNQNPPTAAGAEFELDSSRLCAEMNHLSQTK